MKVKKENSNPLKIILAAGIALALVISWSMVLVILVWGKGVSGETKTQRTAFARYLDEYDLYNAPKRALEGENPEQIEKQLMRLQKSAKSAGEQLSVLKRRRALAYLDRRFIPGYKKAAREAAEHYKFSVPLAMAAAESIVFDRSQLSSVSFAADDLASLKNYAERISQARFDSAELGIRILAGELENPARSAAIPGIENILSRDLSSLPAQIRRNLLIDEFLIRAYKGDIPAAVLRLNSLVAETEVSGNATDVIRTDVIRTDVIRMAAEFFYDHRNPLKAAELFLRCAEGDLSGETELARAADSLVLAGEVPGARNIWLALQEGNVRSLYNLASSSADADEETAWLEKLFARLSEPKGLQPRREQEDNTGIYSAIRYARLQDNSRGTALLEETMASEAGKKQKALLDLELLRRRQETWPPTRSTAEVWLLLSRNPGNQPLYEWAAWYFDHQKLYSESTQLIKDATRQGMAGTWLSLHRSLALIRDGKINEAEKILKEANGLEASRFGSEAGRAGDWRIPANLGRIEENRRSISAALGYYEEAAVLLSDQRTSIDKVNAAHIQMRISRCLEALGRGNESRRAMELAGELDPDNINIRRELRR